MTSKTHGIILVLMKIRFQMWIDEDLKEKLRKMSDRRGISMARIIEQGVTSFLEQQGYIKPITTDVKPDAEQAS